MPAVAPTAMAAHGDAPPSSSSSSSASSSATGGVCACCVVCEVTRGPHAGDRAAFSLDSSVTPTATLSVGRKAASWLRLRKDLEVSGLHAELLVTRVGTKGLALTLRDAASTNGTRANGAAVAAGASCAVGDRDLLQFGRSVVRVRVGDVQCPRARPPGGDDRSGKQDYRAGDKKTQEKPATDEPEREPEAPARQEKNEEMKEKQQTEEQSEDPLVVAEAAAAEAEAEAARAYSDENAFETPPPPPKAPLALLAGCMVCGQALAAWSVLEQQLHVNACLDRKAGGATTTTVATQPTATGAWATATTTTTNGRKRKRQAALATRAADEELAVALALSESLVDPEQQVDMEMALVRGELSQLDAQLKKLQKKRVALVKKLEKLEKAKRKVHKGQVRAPDEVQVLMDLEWAFREVFPPSRQVRATTRGDNPVKSTRPAIARLVERFRASDEQEGDAPYVTMWQRCAQRVRSEGKAEGEDMEDNNQEEDDALYVNRLLRSLLDREKQRALLTKTTGQGDNGVIAQEVQEAPQQTTDVVREDMDMTTGSESADGDSINAEGVVPDVVKRVFPNWQDNLAFLRTQSVSDLQDALEEMRRMQAEREVEAVSTEDEDGADGKKDEAAACAFFANEMIRLIAAKEDEVEVVELMDSQDDEDDDGDTRSNDREMPASSGPPSVLSIDDSSDGDEDTASYGSPDPLAASWLGVEDGSEAMEDVGPSEIRVVDVGSSDGFVLPETVPLPKIPPPSTAIVQPRGETAPQQDEPEETSDSRLEGQLLTALKANATLYERVLLLQPLDLKELLDYVRLDAGIKCPKTVLVRFCDRHGITFKS